MIIYFYLFFLRFVLFNFFLSSLFFRSLSGRKEVTPEERGEKLMQDGLFDTAKKVVPGCEKKVSWLKWFRGEVEKARKTIRATHLHPHVRMYFYLSSLIGTFLRLLNSSAEMAIMAVYRCMCVRYTRVPTL